MNYIEKINQTILKMNEVLLNCTSMEIYFKKSRDLIEKVPDKDFEFYVFGFLVNLYNIAITSEYETYTKRFIISNFLSNVLNYSIREKHRFPHFLSKKWKNDMDRMTLSSATLYGECDDNVSVITNMAKNTHFSKFLHRVISHVGEEITYTEHYAVIYITYQFCLIGKDARLRNFFTAFLIELTIEGCFNNGISFVPEISTEYAEKITNLTETDVKKFDTVYLQNWISFLQNKKKKDMGCVKGIKEMKKIIKTKKST